MNCDKCLYQPICDTYANFGVTDLSANCKTPCKLFKNKADFVEVVRCKDCINAIELDKHCELNRFAYKHCALLRGEEERNVWHKYKKNYKDYSLVEPDDYCSYGERSDT